MNLFLDRIIIYTREQLLEKDEGKYLENIPIIRGINGTELVELILKYYDKLSEKYRKMISLKMVYIPVAKEDAE